MEQEKIEMSDEELQSWVKNQVEDNISLISPSLVEKYTMLESVLDRRRQQMNKLLNLCQSVAACEDMVKKLYTSINWEYRESDSGDDMPINELNCMFSEDDAETPAATCKSLKPQMKKVKEKQKFSFPMEKRAVVVLERLPLPPNNSENVSSEDEGSGVEWQPGNASSNSDSVSEDNSSKKRRKVHRSHKKTKRIHSVSEISKAAVDREGKPKRLTAKKSTGFKITKIAPTSKLKVKAKEKTLGVKLKDDAKELMKSKANATTKKSSGDDPQKNKPTEKASSKTSPPKVVPPANKSVVTVNPQAQAVIQSLRTAPTMPAGEITLDMKVVARRKKSVWVPGKLIEIITKDEGRMKYKIQFEELGKCLVSGHHVAFGSMPYAEQLFIGARVVVKENVEEPVFTPGIIAELPNRKNRMRFLVFLDDEKSRYIGLPLLHLVFKPLEDPVEDIPNEDQQEFLRRYLKEWPHPFKNMYKVGQTVFVQRDGTQEKCEVLTNDCSLMEVMFTKDQHKEWFYRGAKKVAIMPHLEQRATKTNDTDPTSGPSKSAN